MASFLHVLHSKKAATELDNGTFEALVDYQVASRQPIRAPWFRDVKALKVMPDMTEPPRSSAMAAVATFMPGDIQCHRGMLGLGYLAKLKMAFSRYGRCQGPAVLLVKDEHQCRPCSHTPHASEPKLLDCEQGVNPAGQHSMVAPFRQPTRKQLQLVDKEQLAPSPGLANNAPRPVPLSLAPHAPCPAPLNTSRVYTSTSEGTATDRSMPISRARPYRPSDYHSAPPPGFARKAAADLESSADSGWGRPYMPPIPPAAAAAAGPRTGTGVFVPQRTARR